MKHLKSKLAIQRKITKLSKELKIIREKRKRFSHRGEYNAWACHRIILLEGQIEGLKWAIDEQPLII